MKRFYSMLLALLMIFSLCACGAGSNMAKSESAPADVEALVKEITDEIMKQVK